jgi:hypothetical protein
MIELTEETIVEFFKRLRLETESDRGTFLKFSPSSEMPDEAQEQIFILIYNNTSAIKMEDNSNA